MKPSPNATLSLKVGDKTLKVFRVTENKIFLKDKIESKLREGILIINDRGVKLRVQVRLPFGIIQDAKAVRYKVKA